MKRTLFSTTLALLVLISLTGCGEVTSVAPPGDGATGQSLTLTWDPPSFNEDYTQVDDLSGFRVYYGIESGIYSGMIDVGGDTFCDMDALSNGVYYVVVTAYDRNGNESGYSNELVIDL